MAYLEYRLIDGDNYPALSYYESIDKDEIALRFTCDFFVQDGKVYQQISTAVENDSFNRKTYVIYVQHDEEEQPLIHASSNTGFFSNIRVELRHFKGENEKNHPLIHFVDFRDDDDAILYLLSTLFYANKKEWSKTSTEVDEDRKIYVIYVEPNE